MSEHRQCPRPSVPSRSEGSFELPVALDTYARCRRALARTCRFWKVFEDSTFPLAWEARRRNGRFTAKDTSQPWQEVANISATLRRRYQRSAPSPSPTRPHRVPYEAPGWGGGGLGYYLYPVILYTLPVPPYDAIIYPQ